MKHLSSKWVWFIVIVIYTVGLIGFLIPSLHPIFIWLIPSNLLFAFIVLLVGEEKMGYQKIILFFVCFVFGYLLELAGTKTGLIFGEYQYGDSLGIKLWDVPLLIGVNWFFMVYTSLALSSKITELPLLKILLAPSFMVLYDFFLEPFAMNNGMWAWQNNSIPLQNYAAWYLGGLILCSIAVFGKFNLKNRFAAGLYVVQLLFFVVLYFF